MSFCMFCGKEMKNEMCDCPEFKAYYEAEYQGNQSNGQQSSYDGYDDYQQDDYNNQQGGYGGYQQRGYDNSGQNSFRQGGRGNVFNMKMDRPPFIIPNFSVSFNSVSAFFQSVKDMIGLGTPSKFEGNPFERDIPIVPDCVEAEENELVVKQYNIARLRTRLKFMKAEGRMMVTNKRVLFRAAGTAPNGHIVQEHEFNLDELAGIEIRKDYRFSFLNLILCSLLQGVMYFLCLWALNSMKESRVAVIVMCLIFGTLGILPTFFVYKRFWLKVACSTLSLANNAVLMGILNHSSDDNTFFTKLFIFFTVVTAIITIINFFIVCFVENVLIKVKTKGASPAINICRINNNLLSMFFRNPSDESVGFAEVLPWEDTVMAMDEIGTLIEDLQRSGDYAVQKWTV